MTHKLIHEETILVNDPLFSKEAVDQYTDKKLSNQDNSKKRISTYATNSKSDKEEKRDVQTRDPLCIACNKDHLLDSCKIFVEKTLKERIKLLANKELLWPVTTMPKPAGEDYFAGFAKSTGMHGYVKKASEENAESKDGTKVTVKCASVKGKLDTEVISMCVVPVWVGHRSSKKMVKAYAMLDNCSQRSFIKDEIIEDLGVSGGKLKLSLKTLTGEKSEDNEAVDGLIISAIDSKKGRPMRWLELSKAYSQNCLPVEREEIAVPDKIKRWEYLKPIPKVITQIDNINVGMLIAANWMKSLESMEIISSRNGAPYAYIIKLGWCIVGPVTTSRNDGSIKCHRIAVKDVASGKVALHHFVLDDELKIEDVVIKEMLEQMYYSDFCE